MSKTLTSRFTHVAHARTHARTQLIGSVYGAGDGVLPTRAVPDETLRYPTDPGVVGLVWNISNGACWFDWVRDSNGAKMPARTPCCMTTCLRCTRRPKLGTMNTCAVRLARFLS